MKETNSVTTGPTLTAGLTVTATQPSPPALPAGLEKKILKMKPVKILITLFLALAAAGTLSAQPRNPAPAPRPVPKPVPRPAPKPSVKPTIPEVIPVSSVSISRSSLSLKVGETDFLRAEVLPSNATNPDVTWSSSNPYVVSVNSNGAVTAVAKGTATIKATAQDDSGVYAYCEVEVKQFVTSVSLNETRVSLYVGGILNLTASTSPSNASDRSLTWLSSNESVATVDKTNR